MKRIAIAAVALLAFVLVGSAIAGGQPVFRLVDKSLTPEFDLTSSTCPNLPEGTAIHGTGTGTSITTVMIDRNGVETIMNTTHEFGTATDQDGNVYVFQYANSFRVSGPADGDLVGLMTDHFSLSGPGPANLDNGFTAVFNITQGTLDPISSHGDPIDFATGEELCDPL